MGRYWAGGGIARQGCRHENSFPRSDSLQILPWDSDIDVQMTNSTVDFLAKYYNMTIHTYQKRDFMLEVNPKYTDPSYDDYLNVIDARWIDYQTGLFIDITAVRPHESKRNTLCSKDQHEEAVSEVCALIMRFVC